MAMFRGCNRACAPARRLARLRDGENSRIDPCTRRRLARALATTSTPSCALAQLSPACDVLAIASPSPTTFDGVGAHTIEHAAVDFAASPVPIRTASAKRPRWRGLRPTSLAGVPLSQSFSRPGSAGWLRGAPWCRRRARTPCSGRAHVDVRSTGAVERNDTAQVFDASRCLQYFQLRWAIRRNEHNKRSRRQTGTLVSRDQTHGMHGPAVPRRRRSARPAANQPTPMRPPSRSAAGISLLGSPVETSHSWWAARVTPMWSMWRAQCWSG